MIYREKAPFLDKESEDRAQFEQWYVSQPYGGVRLPIDGEGRYANILIQKQWEGWQARAKLSAPQVAPVVPDEKKILQAVSRGWTHEENKHKEVDAALAFAIAKEILALLKGEK